MEQRAIEPARGAVINVLDDSMVAQPGIAQAGGKALVAAMGDLAIDEQAEPIGVGQGCAFAGGFEFGERLGHAGKPEFAQQAVQRRRRVAIRPYSGPHPAGRPPPPRQRCFPCLVNIET